jgi:hypothetical protein
LPHSACIGKPLAPGKIGVLFVANTITIELPHWHGMLALMNGTRTVGQRRNYYNFHVNLAADSLQIAQYMQLDL